MQEWRSSLPGFFDRAWKEIEDFRTKRSGTLGLITLASVGNAGRPEMRTVVLRRVNRNNGTVETFTDSATPKVEEIRANSIASVLIWQPENGLQIRLQGTAKILDGEPVRLEWDDIPEVARKNYGVTPAPGTVIANSSDYQRIPNPDRLANLKMEISEMDVVHLSTPYDIRARYYRSDGWSGQWLSP
jgi:pyridoxamine 5'-phosphate oxidase